MKILINHIGYEAQGAKHAVILGSADQPPLACRILEYETGREIWTGNAQEIGPVQKWKDWHFWTVDFDSVQREGRYIIECLTELDTIHSSPFDIQAGLLDRHTISNVLYYFKAQRCSGEYDKADSHLLFAGDTSGRTIDAHGGWYDASGDYGKHLSHLCFSTYFNPQQIPLVVWSLLKSYAALHAENNGNFAEYEKRLLDEAMFGADFLTRLKNPGGSFYISVAGLGAKKPEERRLEPAMRNFKIAESAEQDVYRRVDAVRPEESYETSYRSGAGISIAVLALASTHSVSGEFSQADYLKAAENGFAFLEEHNASLTNDGKENIVDDYCALVAATELYKATRKEPYKAAADKRAKSILSRQIEISGTQPYWRADDGDRPFFHAADAGFPVVSLLNYLSIADEATRQTVLAAVRKSLLAEMAITAEVANPFGYSRQLVQNKDGVKRTAFFFPHDSNAAPWWQGENARLASMAAAARAAIPYFVQDAELCRQLAAFATNQLNWILGLNPFDSCMLNGSGRNNPAYMFFESYQYTNCPGGISNGITSGWQNEDDIDFQVPFSITGQDSDWRWGEQWLPHAAWFLLAVSFR